MLSNFEFYHANFKYYERLGLVEIHGECWYFCCRRLPTQVGLGLQVLTRYLWILLSVSVPFSKPLQCYLYLSCLVASMELGRGLLWSSSLRCTSGSDPHMCSLVVSPGIYKQQVLRPGHLARLLLLAHIFYTFWFFEASFLVLWPVNWPSLVHSAVHFLKLCSHVGPSDRTTERGLTVVFSPNS